MAVDNLRVRVFKAVSWTLVGHIFYQVLRFASNLIMTRLLFPETFGVMAVVGVILGGLNAVTQVGLTEAMVNHKHGMSSRFVDTAWVMKIGRGFAITLLMLTISIVLYVLGTSGYCTASTVYCHKDLPAVLAVSSIAVVVTGFSSTYTTTLIKMISLKRLVIMEVIAQATGIFVMVVYAYYFRSIWALVVGGVVTEVLKTYVSHRIVKPSRNRMAFDRDFAKEILQVSRWMLVGGVFFYIASTSDRIVLGFVVGADTLGIYSVAFLLASALQQVVLIIASRVIYPALSEVHKTPGRSIKNVYYKFRRWADVISFVAAGLLMSLGDLLVNMLYRGAYQQAGYMLQILAVSIVGIGYKLADQCLVALGDIRSVSLLTGLQGILSTLLIYFAVIKIGFVAGLWVIGLSFLPYVFGSWYVLRKHKLLDIRLELSYLPILFIAYFFGRLFRVIIGC